MKYLWVATFKDGHKIRQPNDDRYSKHDDSSDWNPSAFRDIQEYDSSLTYFELAGYALDLETGLFYPPAGDAFSLESEPLKDRKLIYFREIEQSWVDGVDQGAETKRFAMGYAGIDKRNKVKTKVIYLNGKY